MQKKAIIYDLDNTIYPVSAIGDILFKPLFDLIIESRLHNNDYDAIRKAIMRTPFRLVAQRFKFSEELTQKGIDLQEEMEYNKAIAPFDDYPEIHTITAERFLVTTGFRKMQLSKIKHLGIENDFKEAHVVNPTVTSKKEVFADILKRYNYSPEEVFVVGDDPESEIGAAKALGIPTILYDKNNLYNAEEADYAISHFKELVTIYNTK
ncbi:HAD family hydrolase [Flavobacterium arcticum]|uniref:HAD family hydrolase n=1 Tax=Flavobacterium arcticum TaxID=1784713 RepID=A0A345HEY2_9FLAO|nr:HAD family hydrolase [Flavobacterium arcticum]AXG75142.1 HAD family hydrolase [Flavobacterium arcticum]KAF2511078.1 HAD family hydrolase [Flavobacterium arcticum]